MISLRVFKKIPTEIFQEKYSWILMDPTMEGMLKLWKKLEAGEIVAIVADDSGDNQQSSSEA